MPPVRRCLRVERIKEHLDEETLERCRKKGGSLKLEEALVLGLGRPGDPEIRARP